MAKYLIEPAPNDTAIDFLKAKRPLGKAAFEQLLPELRAHAFTVAGIGNATALQEVRDLVAAVPAGEDYKATRARVAEVLGRHLPLDPNLFGDEEEREKHERGIQRRAEMVVRNNAFQAYSVSHYRELDEFRDIFTHWKYLTVGDHRVRDTHRALNNLVLPQGHPFWRTHFPPWEFGCRCQVVGLTEEEAEEELAEDRKRPEEERTVLEGPLLERLEKEGVLVRKIGGAPVRINVTSARERGEPGAWRWEPGDLALTFAELESRYDAQTWGMWQAWAKQTDTGNGQTVWDWARRALGGGAALPAPVAAPGVIQGARTLAAVRQAMDDLVREYDTAAAEFEAAKQELVNTPFGAPDYQAKVDELMRQRAKMEAIKERGREAASLPVNERGKVRLKGDARTAQVLPTVANYTEGAGIAERYTAAKYLPEISLDYTPDGRAYYHQGVVAVTPMKEARVIAHEITHGTELQNNLLPKSVEFLRSRRKGKELPKSMYTMMGPGYGKNEIGLEDEFAARGSSPYAARLYFPGVSQPYFRKAWNARLKADEKAAFSDLYATEILTMGIERLHNDPVGFAKLDPDYFNFVISTLQDL